MMNLNRKGEIRTAVIVAVIAVIILVIVILGVFPFLASKITFFKFDFNKTIEPVKELEILRYDIVEDKVAYHNGERYVVFEGGIKLGDNIIKYDDVKQDFINYLLNVRGGFDFEGEKYQIIEVNRERIIVRAGENNPLEIFYGGNVREGFRENSGEVEVGVFSAPVRVAGGYKYFIEINLEAEKFKLSEPVLYNHIKNLDESYVIANEENGVLIFSEEIYSDFSDLTNYRWKASQYSGELFFNDEKLGLIFKLNNWNPESVVVNSYVYNYKDVQDSVNKYTGVRDLVFDVVFSRPINILGKNYCPQLQGSRYIIVDFSKEFEGERCET